MNINNNDKNIRVFGAPNYDRLVGVEFVGQDKI